MSRITRCVLMTAILFGFEAGLAAQSDGRAKLEGKYNVVAAERNGMALDKSSYEGSTFEITDNRIVGKAKDGLAFMSAAYSADQSKKPCAITLSLRNWSVQARELPGLMERTDGGVRLIFALPGGDAPTGFKTKKDQVMYTLDHVK